MNIVRSLEESQPCAMSFTSSWNDSSTALNLTPASSWKLGSFTVTGDALNSSGSAVARDRLMVFHVTNDSSGGGGGGGGNDLEPEQPLRAEIDEESYPVIATAGEPVTFSGFASGTSLDDPNVPAPRVEWNFGEGTITEGETVEHTFTNPGEYRVTTRVTNSSGISDSVTQSVQVLPALSTLDGVAPLTDGNDTLNWDFGNPVPGLEYEVLFTNSDGDVLGQSNQTRGSHRFEKLGTYTMNLRVLDYREEYANGTRAKRSDDPEVQYDKTLLEQRASFTRWEKRPIIQLKSYLSSDAAQQDSRALYGDKNMEVTFDASESFGVTPLNQMTLNWRICKYPFGVCRSETVRSFQGGETRNFSFADPGKYVVKLFLKDKYGQFDSRERLVVVTDQAENFIRGVFDYPITTRNRSTTNEALDWEKLARFGLKPQNARATHREERLTDCRNVLPIRDARQRQIQTIGNPMERLEQRRRFQASTLPKRQRVVQRLPHRATAVHRAVFPQPQRTRRPAVPVRFRRRQPNATAATSSHWRGDVHGQQQLPNGAIRYRQRFRVPKVSITVVPDELLPGNASVDPNDPNVNAPKVRALELNSGDYNNEKHFIQHIRIRRSEVYQGRIAFDVPVYAVNASGQWMRNVTGGFFGQFSSLPPFALQSCGDCNMIQGRAFMRVELDPWMFVHADLQEAGRAARKHWISPS
ncbi:MAG: PKD domain-containing protein [Pleurocapsa sp. SU_196_0]|nr:PKD domain-containing protein [Pleurocapsa sp. SU_196_0]